MSHPDPTAPDQGRRHRLHRAAAGILGIPDPPGPADLDGLARPAARLVAAAGHGLGPDHLAALTVYRWALRWALARTAGRVAVPGPDRWALAQRAGSLLALDVQAAAVLAAVPPVARWQAEARAAAMAAGALPLPVLDPLHLAAAEGVGAGA